MRVYIYTHTVPFEVTVVRVFDSYEKLAAFMNDERWAQPIPTHDAMVAQGHVQWLPDGAVTQVTITEVE